MTVTPIADQISALEAQLAKLRAHQPPKVVFRATPRPGTPLKWDFTASATCADDACAADVFWDFGQSTFDGGPSMAAPGYVWQTPGPKMVKVTVMDSWGAIGAASARITVAGDGPPPGPDPGPRPVPQPAGDGITPFQSLPDGSFSHRVNAAPPGSLVSLPAGTIEVVDFADGQNSAAQGASCYGAQLTGRGLLGSGPTATVLQLKAGSSTKAAAVPPNGPGGAGNPTNNLYVLRVQCAGATVDGLTIRGTEQGHLYNGLRFEAVANPTLSNCVFDSIPGQGGSNPGETFAVNFQRATGKVTIRNVTVLGGQGNLRSAAGIGPNSCSAAIDIDGLVATGLTGSAPVALWQQTGPVTIRNWVSRGNPRHLGAERVAAPVSIYDPVWDKPGIGHDITYTPWAGQPLGSITFYFTDASTLLGRKIVVLTNDAAVKPTVHVFVAGVEQNQADFVAFQGA